MTYFNFKTFSTVPCSLIYETAISVNTANGHFLSRATLGTLEMIGGVAQDTLLLSNS